MGKFTKCCCCECLDDEELPSISISGYVGQGWLGGNPNLPNTIAYCCYSQDFLPIATPSWTKVCTDPIIEAVFNQVRTGENIATANEKAKIFEDCAPGLDYPCPLPIEYCCSGWDSALRNRVRGELTYTRGQKMNFWYRIKRIQVFMFRASLTCPGEGAVCKIGMIVKKEWEYRYENVDYKIRNRKQEITEVGSCFKKNASGDADPLSVYSCDSNACEYDQTVTTGPDCESMPGLGVLTEWLSRMKIFDEMPTGNQVFDDSDLGTELCVGGLCYNEGSGWYGNIVGDSFYSSVCIESPAETMDTCWISAALQAVGSLSGQALNSCGCDSNNPPFGGNIQIVCCEEPSTSVGATCCDFTEGDCNEFNCDKGWDVIFPDCPDNFDDITGLNFCEADWFPDLILPSGCFGSSVWPLGTCTIPKTYAESPGCYYDVPCDGHVFTYGGPNIGVQLTNTLNVTSTGSTPRQVCFSFGSVAVVFE